MFFMCSGILPQGYGMSLKELRGPSVEYGMLTHYAEHCAKLLENQLIDEKVIHQTRNIPSRQCNSTGDVDL